MQRYTNTLLRHIWLFIIMFFLTQVLVIVAYQPLPEYKASATLWLDLPLFFDTSQLLDINSTGTETDNSKTFFDELLSSGTFLKQLSGKVVENGYPLTLQERTQLEVKIASNLRVRGLVNSLTFLDKNLQLSVGGKRAIMVEFDDVDKAFALVVCRTVVHTLKDVMVDRVKTRGDGILKLLATQVDDAKATSDTATNSLQSYVANSNSGSFLNLPGQPNVITDKSLQYDILLQQQTDALVNYTNLKDRLDQMRFSYGAFSSGQYEVITIPDEPIIISTIYRDQISWGILFGLICGFLQIFFSLLIITWFDETLWEKIYARKILRVALVVELPDTASLRNISRS